MNLHRFGSDKLSPVTTRAFSFDQINMPGHKARFDPHRCRERRNGAVLTELLKWSRLSEQIFRFDKWVSAGVRLPSGMAVH